LGTVSLDWDFFTGLLSIILIDIVLAGDNAVVIAMAVKSLPKAQRTKGILFGVAGACKGDGFLLLFGLGLSIPLVLFTSSFFSTLMDRYPFVLYIGAAILGAVGGEMIATDPFISALYP